MGRNRKGIFRTCLRVERKDCLHSPFWRVVYNYLSMNKGWCFPLLNTTILDNCDKSMEKG